MNTPSNVSHNDSLASDNDSSSAVADPDSGCRGWIPAILAAAMLVLFVFFVCCAGGTYWLFQQRGEFAIRTAQGTLIPAIEQSRMAPDDKATTIQQLNDFVQRVKSGELDDWQAAGVMQRLVRSPLLSWGDLAYVESHILASPHWSDEEKERTKRCISRVRRAAELDKITQVEMVDLFAPISEAANVETGYQLTLPLVDDRVREFVQRACRAADDAGVPDGNFDVQIDAIVRWHIESGIESGMK